MLSQSYARTYRANAILTASPGQLVLLLYDGALNALALARQALAQPESEVNRIATVNQQLLKAQAILHELQNGLNLEAGGDLARTLYRLYEYHNRRLFEANLRKSEGPIIEVEQLVRELRDAWAQMLAHGGESVETPERVGT
jgi:flagellar secretion chaperone FliS